MSANSLLHCSALSVGFFKAPRTLFLQPERAVLALLANEFQQSQSFVQMFGSVRTNTGIHSELASQEELLTVWTRGSPEQLQHTALQRWRF